VTRLVIQKDTAKLFILLLFDSRGNYLSNLLTTASDKPY